MRVLQIVHQYPPEHIGGVELITQTLAHGLVERGHEVHVLTRAPANPPATGTEGGVTVHRLALPASPSRRFLAAFNDNTALDATLAILQSVKPDVVHLQHLMGHPLAVVQAIREAGMPYVITLHDYWYACANAQLITNFDERMCDGPAPAKCGKCAAARAGLPAWSGIAFAPLMRRRNDRLHDALAGAAAVTMPSQFVRDLFRSLGYDTQRWRVMPYGLDFCSQPRKPHEGIRFAYIGGLAKQKGVHVLIEAFNEVPEDRHLFIAGPEHAFPNYVTALKAAARHPNIHFIGAQTRAQVWALLSETDVVVVPAMWHETASLIAREAAAAGCGLIASRMGALTEVAEANDSKLVAPGDVPALREALLNARPSTRQPTPYRDTTDYTIDMENLYKEIAR
jgi:glycosyltransferase involved in cell wall biosynthesis